MTQRKTRRISKIKKRDLSSHEKKFFVIIIVIATYLLLEVVYAALIKPLEIVFKGDNKETKSHIELQEAPPPSVDTKELLKEEERTSNIITRPKGAIHEAKTIGCDVGSIQKRDEMSGQLVCISATIIKSDTDCIAPNGEELEEEEEYTAYKPGDKTCTPQKRKCKNGELNGDKQYILDSCKPTQTINTGDQRTYCTGENNVLIPNGSYTILFKDKVVDKDQNCEFIESRCINGELVNKQGATERTCKFAKSFSNEYIEERPWLIDEEGKLKEEFLEAKKEIINPLSCALPRGEKLEHGEKEYTFKKAVVPFDEYCTFSLLECDNGNLIGGEVFNHEFCRVGEVNNCSIQGKTVGHGESITTYKKGSIQNGRYVCPETQRTCFNGNLDGDESYTLTVCSLGQVGKARCINPRGGTPIPHGSSVTAYNTTQVGRGESCDPHAEKRTCNNGVLGGSFAYQNCKAKGGDSCTAPRGGVVQHGKKVKAYAKNVYSFGEKCDAAGNVEIRECINGTLKGSFGYQTCQKNQPRSCTLPDGSIISHDTTITLYQYKQVQGVPEDGIDECPRQVRKCHDSQRVDFSGQANPYTFKYRECNVISPERNTPS